jgi:hypothetical protein
MENHCDTCKHLQTLKTVSCKFDLNVENNKGNCIKWEQFNDLERSPWYKKLK